mgnify:CR=1 FL=1|tara:strand:+ start:1744 stop:2043 length:300 start_codon:yes stop_codon:yes gene_type:complete
MSEPESNGAGRSKPFIVLQRVNAEDNPNDDDWNDGTGKGKVSWVDVPVVTSEHTTASAVRRALKEHVTADPKNGGHFRIVQVKDEVAVVGETRTVAVFS